MSEGLADDALRDAVERLEAASAALQRRSVVSIRDGLVEAWSLLADPERALGREARQRLPESTGLSLAGVAWALTETLRGVSADLAAIAERMTPPPGQVVAPARLSVLVLAGNVFTACVQPCSVALLARSPVLVKASSKDDVLPHLFHQALVEVDPELADALLVVTFPGGRSKLEAALLSRADVVSAFGSDDTITTLRRLVLPTCTFIAHGHGLGVGWVPRASIDSAPVAKAFALDVAAYDQRGCMSPHTIFVEGEARGFAERLGDALRDLEGSMPRGPLPIEVGATQLQWRGMAEARGALIEGNGWAVSCDAGLRISPGYRNVTVTGDTDRSGLLTEVVPLGAHLKALGVADDEPARRELAAMLGPGLAPRVCEAGHMQRPSLTGLADGRAAWEGFLRYRALG